MKIHPVVAEFFHADGRTASHDEADSLLAIAGTLQEVIDVCKAGVGGFYMFCENNYLHLQNGAIDT